MIDAGRRRVVLAGMAGAAVVLGGCKDRRVDRGPAVRMIPVDTPSGRFRVWTKRVGDSPRIRVLLLHGGPGSSHDYLEVMDKFLPPAGIEYVLYDQLGGGNSDRPADPALWSIPRFVSEVEQVRRALGMGPDSFYLYGHSWGGALAIEYALAHPGAAKGLVVSNMMASSPAYNAYARDVLEPQMDPAALAKIKALEAAGRTDDPRYMDLLTREHYVHHFLRLPPDRWPDAVQRTFAKLNPAIYVPMQGPSELGITGSLATWDRMADLPRIATPTLVLGARHDTMDPAHIQAMARAMPHGRSVICPNGSHLAMYDDQQCYFHALVGFLKDVDAGRFA